MYYCSHTSDTVTQYITYTCGDHRIFIICIIICIGTIFLRINDIKYKIYSIPIYIKKSREIRLRSTRFLFTSHTDNRTCKYADVTLSTIRS